MDPLKAVLLSALVGAIVSLVVDSLKARFAGRWWEAQERWKLKRDVYLRLLDALWELKDAFQIQLRLESFGDPLTDPEAAHRQRQRYAEALKKVYEARGTIPLLLHPDTVKALDQLDSADAIDCPTPYLQAVKGVYTDVLAAAQNDLRLRLR